MTSEQEERLEGFFKAADDEFLKFDSIPKKDRRHERKDLCAFLYLHEKIGGNGDVVGHAEKEEIFLEFGHLEKLTQEDVVYIHRCGVRYDQESLCMFV